MERAESHSRSAVGFILVFVFLVVLLLATRGAMEGAYAYLITVNWIAGLVFLILATLIPIWLVLRYASSTIAD